jgi:hypothetical protein
MERHPLVVDDEAEAFSDCCAPDALPPASRAASGTSVSGINEGDADAVSAGGGVRPLTRLGHGPLHTGIA